MKLILASTSPYRRALLERLGLDFECVPPGSDETPRRGESSSSLAQRLAYAKANAIARKNPGALVIGSDQVASLGDQLLGKPGDMETATRQLQQSSGRSVLFHTAVCLANSQGRANTVTVESRVDFRELEDVEIENYLRREQPFDCAGSFKCEGQGIALFERLESEDPTALEGLPLIATAQLLRAAGMDPLQSPTQAPV